MIIKLKNSELFINLEKIYVIPSSQSSEEYKKKFSATFYPNHNIQLIDFGIIGINKSINEIVEAVIIDDMSYTEGELFIDISIDNNKFILKATHDNEIIYNMEDQIVSYNNESTVVDSFEYGIHVESPRDLELIVHTF